MCNTIRCNIGREGGEERKAYEKTHNFIAEETAEKYEKAGSCRIQMRRLPLFNAGKRKYGLQKNAFLHAVPTGIHVKYYRAALCLYQIEKQEKTKKLGGDRT